MLNRSLATFMNAFTGKFSFCVQKFGELLLRYIIFFIASDYTIYPFATTNPVDYANLRDVYMDAAFHPKLDRLDFKQEGWRLEHEVPTGNLPFLLLWSYMIF